MSFFRVPLQKRDKLNSIAADGDIRFLAPPLPPPAEKHRCDNKLSSVIVSAARRSH